MMPRNWWIAFIIMATLASIYIWASLHADDAAEKVRKEHDTGPKACQIVGCDR